MVFGDKNFDTKQIVCVIILLEWFNLPENPMKMKNSFFKHTHTHTQSKAIYSAGQKSEI